MTLTGDVMFRLCPQFWDQAAEPTIGTYSFERQGAWAVPHNSERKHRFLAVERKPKRLAKGRGKI